MVAGDGPHGFVPPTLIPCRVGHPRLCPVVGSPSVNSGGKTYYQGGPGSGVIHLSLSSVVVLPLPLYISFFLFYSFLHIGTQFFGQKSGVSPVFNQLWKPAASNRLVDVRYPFGWTHQCGEWTLFRLTTWTVRSWDPSLRPREWGRWYPSAIMVGYIGLPP